MINESDCSRDFSKEMTKKYRDTHKKIRNCNESDNSLNFAKVSQNLWKSWFIFPIPLICLTSSPPFSIHTLCAERLSIVESQLFLTQQTLCTIF